MPPNKNASVPSPATSLRMYEASEYLEPELHSMKAFDHVPFAPSSMRIFWVLQVAAIFKFIMNSSNEDFTHSLAL